MYTVKTVISDYHTLPDTMRHYLKFNLYENIGFLGQNSYGLPLYEYEIATTELQGKPLSFSFRPENDGEEQKLLKSAESNSNGELPINVWMTPELRLGDTILKSEGRYRLGYDMKVRYGIESPNSTMPSVVNKDIVAGEYHAIGYNLQGMSQQQLESTKKTLEDTQKVLASSDNNTLAGLTRHDTTGAMLQGTVQSYLAINEKQDSLQASASNIVQSYHLSFGTFSTTLSTIYRYGLPWRTKPIGMTMDMDRLLHQVVSKDNVQAESISYLQTQGMRESNNENLIPEKIFEKSVEGISAIKALKLASEQGQEILTINADNRTGYLGKISSHSAKTLTDVRNALNAGLQVTISEKPLTLNSWRGAGYILLDTAKGTGAYMLEGGTNGGFSELIDTVENVGCPASTNRNTDNTCTVSGESKASSLAVSGMITNFYENTVKFVPAILMVLVLSVIKNMFYGIIRLTKCHEKEIRNALAIFSAAMILAGLIARLGSWSPQGRLVGLGVMIASIPLLTTSAYAATGKMKECDDECERNQYGQCWVCSLASKPVITARKQIAKNHGLKKCNSDDNWKGLHAKWTAYYELGNARDAENVCYEPQHFAHVNEAKKAHTIANECLSWMSKL